jgi:UDP-2,4-diacetamido-2,4,6-trideoxy-beta-L-altropyranose hydrolase
MKVCIVTEGTAKTGYGHLTRCLALFQGFEEKNIIPTFIANCDESGKQVLKDIQIENIDWIADTEGLLKTVQGSDITIIDSYLAELSLYEKVSAGTKRCVYLDDTQRLQYPPGVIINGAVGAEDLSYQNANGNDLLLGLEYTPLRKEFWDINVNAGTKSKTDILVTIGAQDYDEISIGVLEVLLKNFPQYSYHVVLGFHDFGEKLTLFKKSKQVTFYDSLNASEMRNLMYKCWLAVSAAGQTSYELARCGVGMILILVAENQLGNITGWSKKGLIKNGIKRDNLPTLIDDFQYRVNCSQDTWPQTSGQGVRKIVTYLTKNYLC